MVKFGGSWYYIVLFGTVEYYSVGPYDLSDCQFIAHKVIQIKSEHVLIFSSPN